MFGKLLCFLGLHNWVELGGGWFVCERGKCGCMKFELNTCFTENKEKSNARKNRGIAYTSTV